MLFRLFSCFMILSLFSCSASRKQSMQTSALELEMQDGGSTFFEDWMHSPIRPQNDQAITFYVEADNDSGIEAAELYVYEYELFKNKQGLPSQRKRKGGQWGLLREWQLPSFPKRLHLDHVHGDGFKPHSRIEYIWRIKSKDGKISDRFARFDAGDSPWPQDKILVYSSSRKPMVDVIDLSFVMDTDYNGKKEQFHRDVEAMITRGFLSPQSYSNDRSSWAFYITDEVVDGKAISLNIGREEYLPDFVKDFSVPGVDAFCLIHQEDYTDRSMLVENFHALSNNFFSAEAKNWGTAIHESGHAIFHLSDEYDGCACFQSHESNNVFKKRSDCVTWNIAHGFPAKDCHEVKDVYNRNWYSAEENTFFLSMDACRSYNQSLGIHRDSCRTFVDSKGNQKYWAFESTCIMHDDGDHIVRPFQKACKTVMSEYYQGLSKQNFDPAFAKNVFDNIFGYEEVCFLDIERNEGVYSFTKTEKTWGVPTKLRKGGEVSFSFLNAQEGYGEFDLSMPNAVHRDSHKPFVKPVMGNRARVAISAGLKEFRVIEH